MGLLQKIGQLRNDHIERKAAPFLEEGEEIVSWVRARDPDDGRHGVFFITQTRALVHWSGRSEGHGDIEWTEFRTWGLNQESKHGPVLCIETRDGGATFIQVAVDTKQMARTASEFIRSFADLAPWPERGPENGKAQVEFVPSAEAELHHDRRTPQEMAKRVALTVLGAGLIIVGIIIIPLPGPWSFILNIAGLAVLSKEYDWAKDLLDWSKERFESAKKKVVERRKRRQKA